MEIFHHDWYCTVVIDIHFFFRDIENDQAIERELASKGQHQKELIGNLLADEKCQRNAFATLFTKQDTRHKEISSQVEQIQSELASLTMVEMTKKDLKVQATALIFQIDRLQNQRNLSLKEKL